MVHQYAKWLVLAGVFVTSLYSFRLLYLAFFGKERFVVDAGHHAHGNGDGHGDGHDDGHDDHGHHTPGHLAHPPHESPWVVTLPLVLLAIPSVAIGFLTVQPMLFGGFFDGAIFVKPEHDRVARIGEHFGSPFAFGLHGFVTPAFWLALGGFAAATLMYLLKPELAGRARTAFAPIVAVLERKYGFDDFYQAVFMRGSVLLGRGLWRGGDVAVIDDGIVNGSAGVVDRLAGLVRRAQSGYLYHYAFSMILGLIVLLGFFAWPR